MARERKITLRRKGNYMTVYLLALLTGIVAGLRSMAAPAMVCWAARLGLLDLSGTWLAFLGNVWARWILTLLALAELVTDQHLCYANIMPVR
jgi:uncharacterized membrane protein